MFKTVIPANIENLDMRNVRFSFWICKLIAVCKRKQGYCSVWAVLSHLRSLFSLTGVKSLKVTVLFERC